MFGLHRLEVTENSCRSATMQKGLTFEDFEQKLNKEDRRRHFQTGAYHRTELKRQRPNNRRSSSSSIDDPLEQFMTDNVCTTCSSNLTPVPIDALQNIPISRNKRYTQSEATHSAEPAVPPIRPSKSPQLSLFDSRPQINFNSQEKASGSSERPWTNRESCRRNLVSRIGTSRNSDVPIKSNCFSSLIDLGPPPRQSPRTRQNEKPTRGSSAVRDTYAAAAMVLPQRISRQSKFDSIAEVKEPSNKSPSNISNTSQICCSTDPPDPMKKDGFFSSGQFSNVMSESSSVDVPLDVHQYRGLSVRRPGYQYSDRYTLNI